MITKIETPTYFGIVTYADLVPLRDKINETVEYLNVNSEIVQILERECEDLEDKR